MHGGTASSTSEIRKSRVSNADDRQVSCHPVACWAEFHKSQQITGYNTDV